MLWQATNAFLKTVGVGMEWHINGIHWLEPALKSKRINKVSNSNDNNWILEKIDSYSNKNNK